ncbi:MAG: hypothetical protein ACTS2F_06880 [Thainema sp.]
MTSKVTANHIVSRFQYRVYHRPCIGHPHCVAAFKFRSHAEIYVRGLISISASSRHEYEVVFIDPVELMREAQQKCS